MNTLDKYLKIDLNVKYIDFVGIRDKVGICPVCYYDYGRCSCTQTLELQLIKLDDFYKKVDVNKKLKEDYEKRR